MDSIYLAYGHARGFSLLAVALIVIVVAIVVGAVAYSAGKSAAKRKI